MKGRLLSWGAFLLLTAACSDDAPSVEEDGSVPRDAQVDSGPKNMEPWAAGDYPAEIGASSYLEIPGLPGSNGLVREYKVHVPPGYDPSTPMPVLFCFHGARQNPILFCVNASGLPAKSDAEGFILVMPKGLNATWDSGTCCATTGVNEPEFIRAIVDELGLHLNIDRKRIYAAGLSNGGYLSYRLACELSDVFVAIAPSAAGIGIPSIGGSYGTNSGMNTTFTKCEPKHPVAVLDVHGTADMIIEYSKQKPSLELMAAANGCSLTTEPALLPASGGDTTCVTYAGCPAGVEVTGCTIQGGGHCWFGDPSGSCGTGAPGYGNMIVGADSNFFVTTDAAWDFLKRFSR